MIIYADFECILLPEDNGNKAKSKRVLYKQISRTFACSYGYKLVCADDKFSKPFKSYLGKDAVYNFINSMVEESRYCSEVIKKRFNKELGMTKKNYEDSKNSTEC